MSRFNIFCNPFIEAQVGYLLDTYDAALRKQTEEYWRQTIAREIIETFPYMANIELVESKIRNG